MGLLFFYLSLALFVSFLCSILEAVLLSITPSYIGSLEEGAHFKTILEKIKKDLDTSISSILILNTIAHTMGAAGVGAEAVRIFGVEWQSAIAVILTLLILYFSEIIPKTIGAAYWRSLAKPTAYTINVMIRFLAPFLWISRFITRRIKKHQPDKGLTREEIAAMAAIGEEKGILEQREGALIENLLKLKQIQIKDILTPRSVVFALDSDASIESALRADDLFIYSRIPVYEKSADNIIGMVFTRSILKSVSLKDMGHEPLKNIRQPIFRVPEDMPVYFLLDHFIKRKEHMFLVHDAYRQFSGIVTLEDALETLLGREIIDEADQVEDMQNYALEKAALWQQQLEKKSRQ